MIKRIYKWYKRYRFYRALARIEAKMQATDEKLQRNTEMVQFMLNVKPVDEDRGFPVGFFEQIAELKANAKMYEVRLKYLHKKKQSLLAPTFDDLKD